MNEAELQSCEDLENFLKIEGFDKFGSKAPAFTSEVKKMLNGYYSKSVKKLISIAKRIPKKDKPTNPYWFPATG